MYHWRERAAFKRSAFGRSTAGNDVVATIFIRLFFFSVFFSPSSTFLIEGVLRESYLIFQVEVEVEDEFGNSGALSSTEWRPTAMATLVPKIVKGWGLQNIIFAHRLGGGV